MNRLRKWLRAYKVSQHRRRLEDKAHIEWAHDLIGSPVDKVNKEGTRFRQFADGRVARREVDEYGEPYWVMCERKIR